MSRREPEPEAGTNLWCVGLRQSGRRPLQEGERRELEARLCRARRAGLLALAVALLLLPLAPALALLPEVGTAPSTAATTLAIVAMGFAVCRFRDGRQEAAALRRDLRLGSLYCFEGEPRLDLWEEKFRRRLVAFGILPESPGSRLALEVLPASGLVWRANGRRPEARGDRRVRLPLVRLADLPRHAAVAAEWTESADRDDPEAPHIGTRELAAAESTEIDRCARRLLRVSIVGLAALCLMALLATRALLHLGAQGPLLPTLVVALFVGSSLGRFRLLRLAWELRSDRTVGRVVIVRFPRSAPGTEPAAAPRSLAEPVEYLPSSGLVWTERGRPADWRFLPLA